MANSAALQDERTQRAQSTQNLGGAANGRLNVCHALPPGGFGPHPIACSGCSSCLRLRARAEAWRSWTGCSRCIVRLLRGSCATAQYSQGSPVARQRSPLATWAGPRSGDAAADTDARARACAAIRALGSGVHSGLSICLCVGTSDRRRCVRGQRVRAGGVQIRRGRTAMTYTPRHLY
jgi:hypothetical protein